MLFCMQKGRAFAPPFRCAHSFFSEELELPKEILLHLPLISFIGQEEVTIENYKGILEYSEETVRIGTAAGVLRLEGQGLCLKQLSAECMVVTGRVEKMEFLQ